MDLAAIAGAVVAAVLGIVLLAVVLAAVTFPFIALSMLLRPRPAGPARSPSTTPEWTDDDEIAARHHH